MRTNTWPSPRQRPGRPSSQPFVVDIPERPSHAGQMATPLREVA
ncbi:hypothetical protein QT196_20750 [Streptomyces sp. P9-2B-2]|nr:hypothetical protein [Streptomyces sp. P9-2B-2]WJY39519.1 hypothetical protein QT196_20750 [Streptomyces sp. P9-2B-2]